MPSTAIGHMNSACKSTDDTNPTTNDVSMSSSNSLVNMDATTSVPDTDSTTDIVMEEIISNQLSAGNNQKDSLSTPILCEKCSKKSLTIRRLQKNNSYLRRTAQNLRERLNLVRMVTTILKLTITEKLLGKQLVISCLENFLTKKVVEGGGGWGLKCCSPEIFLTY